MFAHLHAGFADIPPRLRPPPARAASPVGDDPRHVDPKRRVVLADAHRDDPDVMAGHTPENAT
jgi:hypothetical protein